MEKCCMKLDCVDGLLIEGVDYSGKTSVTDELVRLLARRSQPTVRRACFLNEHPIIDALLSLAKASNSMEARDVCYTSSLLHDLRMPSLPRPAGYLLQERHVLTQIGRNTFFYDDPERWQVPSMQAMRLAFTCQVYLWSNIEAKRSRTRSRPPKSPRDAMLADDPTLHQRYDDVMRGMLPKGERWLMIDTSNSTVEAVAQIVLAHIDQTGGAKSDVRT
jgi:thymidylate kinase